MACTIVCWCSEECSGRCPAASQCLALVLLSACPAGQPCPHHAVLQCFALPWRPHDSLPVISWAAPCCCSLQVRLWRDSDMSQHYHPLATFLQQIAAISQVAILRSPMSCPSTLIFAQPCTAILTSCGMSNDVHVSGEVRLCHVRCALLLSLHILCDRWCMVFSALRASLHWHFALQLCMKCSFAFASSPLHLQALCTFCEF